MNIIKINFSKISNQEIALIADYFQSGKIIAYPTDTVYGLGCSALNKKAINKIYQIKKRAKEKPFLILVKSYCMLKKYFFVSKKQDKFLRQFWIKNQPGSKPLTVILQSRGILPELIAKDGSAAVRMPVNSLFLMELIKKIDAPIVSTSLNLNGKKVLNNLKKIEDYFGKNQIDLVVDAGKLKSQKASQILDIRDIYNIKILRK